MPVQIWNVATIEGAEWEYSGDPNQIVFAHISGADGLPEFTPADGGVTRVDIESVAVKGAIPGKGMVDIVNELKGGTTLYVTQRRIVAVKRDIDLGPSSAVRALDWVVPGAGFVRDLAHDVGRKMGAAARYHFVAQIDYQSLRLIRYTKGKRFYQGGTGLQLTALLGEAPPAGAMTLMVGMRSDADTPAIAEVIAELAKEAQLSRQVFPLDADQRAATSRATFQKSGDGQSLDTKGAVCLAQYAEVCGLAQTDGNR